MYGLVFFVWGSECGNVVDVFLVFWVVWYWWVVIVDVGLVVVCLVWFVG